MHNSQARQAPPNLARNLDIPGTLNVMMNNSPLRSNRSGRKGVKIIPRLGFRCLSLDRAQRVTPLGLAATERTRKGLENMKDERLLWLLFKKNLNASKPSEHPPQVDLKKNLNAPRDFLSIPQSGGNISKRSR